MQGVVMYGDIRDEYDEIHVLHMKCNNLSESNVVHRLCWLLALKNIVVR